MCGSGSAGPRFNQALWDTGDSLDALPGYVQDEARAPIIRNRWRKMAVMHQGNCPQSQVGNYIAGIRDLVEIQYGLPRLLCNIKRGHLLRLSNK